MTVTLKSIQEAQATIKGVAKKTPLIESPALGKAVGGEVYFKYENLQKTGSFKIRGAANKIAHLTAEEAERGVIAASAGNHVFTELENIAETGNVGETYRYLDVRE